MMGGIPLLEKSAALSAVCLSGCLAVYTSRAYAGGDPFFFVVRQMVWVAVGILFFFLFSKIPFRFYRRFAGWLAGGAAVLLVLVLIFGTTVNHMRGWFPLPMNLRFQPSEFAKAPFLLFLSCLAAGKGENTVKFFKMLGVVLLFCGLIALQPDFGGATVFFGGAVIVIFCSDLPLRYSLFLLFSAVSGAVLFLLRNPYAVRRISGYWNPFADAGGAGWHVLQFRNTLAHGGWFGTESGGAVWSGAYLPLPHSDSAFASIVETSGVAGGCVVIAGFAVLLILFRRMALRSSDPTTRLFLFAVCGQIVFQAMVHIGVNVSMLPPTGVTLPFFSYGGSSIVAVMTGLGMAFSAASGEKKIPSGVS